ncbi:MAG: radical SAM protein [Candidatus Cloacimonetes bacterium]|nr:radical SAM protein [Candidatus Cloacimonadota bacterium]MCF7815118.1 radical SAM protein [Candidatus Cloacimonadota bacterium]MCF7868603.1 radical SAM protein [Candidatus Cloacimonadota bacterium]MCF7882832.1 radical SAM protein [Candidatus Cloacimonadota bacterium]
MKILPIFIPHLGCPFQCIYCNQKTITKSTLKDLEKIKKQIHQFCNYNIDNDKQIAFFGGTFTNLPKEKQQDYFDLVKPFGDDCSIRISTRPDSIDQDILDFCRENNVKTIELGIQSFNDEVLTASKRGYNSELAISVCKTIRENGFELAIQLMPGLPDFSIQSWQETLEVTKSLSPDFVRLYPAIVLKNTDLEKSFLEAKYSPLSLEEAIQTTAFAFEYFEETDIKIIKTGLHSDIEPEQIAAGPYHESFGELVRAEILFNKIIQNFQNKTLKISTKDVSLLKGFNSLYLNRLKSALKITVLPIILDAELEKSRFLFTEKTPQDYW